MASDAVATVPVSVSEATELPAQRPRRRWPWRAAGRYTLLVSVAFIVLFPVYTTVVAALKPEGKVLERPLIPDAFTLQMFSDAWTEGRLGRYLLNSIIVTVVVLVFQVVTSLLSGYAFAILDFPGRDLLFVLFLATLLVPIEATVLVNYSTVDSLGWINSYQGLTAPFLATALGTFLIRQTLLGLPRDLRDAATIDGVGHIGFIRHVAIPLIKPTIGAFALISFLNTWNMYLWPRLATTDPDWNTVQSGLRVLSRAGIDRPNLMMAGTVIAAIPIVIVLVVFQRQLVRGLTAGAVKG